MDRIPLRGCGAALVAALLALLPAAPLFGDGSEGRFEGALRDLCAEDPLVRRRGIAALRGVSEFEVVSAALRPRVQEVLRRRGPEERAAVVPLLARMEDPQATRLWLERLDPEEDERVVEAAVASFRGISPASPAAKELLTLARDDVLDSRRRCLVLEALGAVGGPAAGLLLSTARPGADWIEDSGRALGLGRWDDPSAVPALLELLSHPDPAPRVHAWEGLARRTGRRLPASRPAWEEALRSPAPPPPPEADPERYEAADSPHVPTYYGIPIPRPRSRVVFCLDVSQSMWGDGIDSARRHLAHTLKDLPTTCAFDVVLFNERVMPWSGRLVAAHPVRKALAIEFLEAQETVSYTNLYDAVEQAFSYAGRGRRPAADPVRLDAVFLLSDGAPNRGRYRRDDEVVEGIAALSERRTPVHTIGAGEEVFPLLRRIAAATGGRFADAFEFD